ncbi:hypothetical protein MEA186_31846 [Mesorhizobium amorphae CCNWGS0123]|uniref:Uncharacterized protein n=1 Tax=Mesorhizobium amorphae CCNWGS0123 TaxID=1082933 RepID=G6YK35_9HYPH|nr:hypothetical protein A6B35_30840 [Mesorhizobium amorphae CCNWGS0123]EHH04178.1 hypothetical protein MEA186_31846 [Mesorhizobium amorphae CCNWGS0123]
MPRPSCDEQAGLVAKSTLEKSNQVRGNVLGFWRAWLDMALLAKLVENRLQTFQVARIEGRVKVETITHLGLPRAEILNETKRGDEEPADRRR